LRQSEVEQNQIELFARERVLGRASVAHPINDVARLPQRCPNALANHPIVLDQQHAHGGLPL